MSQALPPTREDAIAALLQWYAASGVDTAEGTEPSDMTAWPQSNFKLSGGAPKLPPRTPDAPAPAAPAPIGADEAPMPTADAIAWAKALAKEADSVEALAALITGFDGCALKRGARNTVVFDGVPRADLLVIGEAPGRDEDQIGKPFVGKAGQLLDRMLAAIGLSRTAEDGLGDVCITNAIYWRPPGNRAPSTEEIAICMPFVERFIALSAPKVVMLTGNVPTQALFPGTAGITRSRGKALSLDGPVGKIPAIPLFHPAFLLRQPAQKRLAWHDLLTVKAALEG